MGNSNRDGLGVDSGAIVGDLSDVAVDVVGVVGNVLHTAVGKGNGVGSLDNTGAIVGLSSVEVGLGVVVSNGVVVGVGGDLVGVHLGDGVGNGVGNNRGVVDDGSGVVDGVGNNGGVDSVGNHRGVVHGVSHGVGNHGGVHGVDGVVDGGVVDSVVHGVGNQLVSTIGAGSNHGEQSSSDESLKLFDPLKKYSLEHSKIFNAFQNF